MKRISVVLPALMSLALCVCPAMAFAADVPPITAFNFSGNSSLFQIETII